MDDKICPLFRMARMIRPAAYDAHVIDTDDDTCLGSQCKWFFAEEGECLVWSITSALRDISIRLPGMVPP